jgi:predicted metalloprotease
MKWEGNRQSDNVEDERGDSGPALGARGLGAGRGLGIGSVVIALVASAVFGVNPLTVLGLLSGQGTPSVQAPAAHTSQPANDSMTRFVRTTLADTEDVWGQLFKQAGSTYQQPKLVLFRGQTATACGAGQAAMGPFYCPADQKVYIDLSFYETLKTQLGAPGDFAQAYVIAHEVGHHVQNLMGVSGKVDAMRSRLSPVQYNAMSVRLELQADCLAGVWAHHANNQRQILENGDVEEAMNAAARIGDDALQKQSQGRVVPESFTHGTSAQRMRWFHAGLTSGQVRQCDTFGQKSI